MNALDYLGKPWGPGAKGPDAFSCWGMIQHVYVKEHGIILPDYVVEDWTKVTDFIDVFEGQTESKTNWFNLPDGETPRQYDVVLLGRSKRPSHVGMWVGASDWSRGRIMHCLQPYKDQNGVGVVAQTFASMKLHNWGYFEFLRNVELTSRTVVASK